MRKRSETVPDAAALWSRLAHVRLAIGRDWPDGAHTEAAAEYARLDALRVAPEVKVERLQAWLERRASPSVVADEFQLLAKVAARYGPVQPVKRLRAVEPEPPSA